MSKSLKVNKYHVQLSATVKSETALTQFLQKRKYSQIFILVDENTKRHCLPKVQLHVKGLEKAEILEIRSGEHYKTLKTCEHLWQELSALNGTREALMINLGGGVIGDMGGFVAGTFKRGIDFIHVPTTLLSMVDASIGGKVGVDMNRTKNLIGLFKNPEEVFIYTEFLETLPEEVLVSGLAEVVKHSLLFEDKNWKHFSAKVKISELPWMDVIHESLKTKRKVVEKDFKEQGGRKILNFGHTLGHGIESASLASGKALLHGEAISAGLIMEVYLSLFNCGLSENDSRHIEEIVQYYFPKYDLSHLDYEAVFEYMLQDKKNRDDRINFTLIKKIGKPVLDQTCAPEQIEAAFNYYLDMKWNAQ